jgi:hypothetical protein
MVMNVLIIINKYAGYFHDGSIREIKHEKDSIIILIESAQLLPEWHWDRKKIPLSKRDTITGRLHLSHIKNIKKNDELFNETFKMIYDHCDIFDLEIDEYRLKMLLTWVQYVPTRQQTDMLSIEIEAEKIYWENIPTLFDDYWDSL